MTETVDDEAPDVLAGRYRVGPAIAHGGASVVHRAVDTETGRIVAVKILPPGSQPARGGRAELDVIAGLRHPGLVALHDVGVEGGRAFVVMDHMEGGTLADRLRDGPLDAAAVMAIGAILADALAHVHARGVVHRDVKPGNVLLDRDGRPRLTDFGIARLTDAAPVTTTGTVIGTAAYMAPEQVRGRSVGAPADVYALGLLLLEAVTGRREYDGTALESAVARLHRRPVVPGSLPRSLAAALRRMTATEPAARPAAAAVAAVLRGGGRLPGLPSSRARRTLPVAVASMAAAAVAGTLALGGTGAAPDQDLLGAEPVGPPPTPRVEPAPPLGWPVPGLDDRAAAADAGGGRDGRDGREDDADDDGDDDGSGDTGRRSDVADGPARVVETPPEQAAAAPAEVAPTDAAPADAEQPHPAEPDAPLLDPVAQERDEDDPPGVVDGPPLPSLPSIPSLPSLVPGLLDGAGRIVPRGLGAAGIV